MLYLFTVNKLSLNSMRDIGKIYILSLCIYALSASADKAFFVARQYTDAGLQISRLGALKV